MKKILVICGPTATGKTGLALKLAKKFKGEVVSFDSRQVYKGMDIVTGKDVLGAKFKDGFYLIKGIKIWLYDLVEPDYQFNVADFTREAKKVIKDIWQRGELPILAGGTGFYLKALLEGIESLGILPDFALREELSYLKLTELQKRLKRFNPQRWIKMNTSDQKNPRRLIRAIEVSLKKDKVLKKSSLKANLLKIGLKAPLKDLYHLVDQRVEKRVEVGAEKEIKALMNKGYNFKNSILGTTIGYRQWRPYFEGKKTKKEVIFAWKNVEHGYVRRQLTWFRKDKQIKWFDILSRGWQDKVERTVFLWYTKK